MGAGAVFVAGLAIVLAGRLGALHPALDLAALAAFPAACAVCLSAGVLVFRRIGWFRRLLVIGLTFPALLALQGEAVRSAPCIPGDLRLRAAWINAHSPVTPEPIIAWLDREQPDVVGLAELVADSTELRQALALRYPYWQSCLGNGRCSTVLYSRFQPVEIAGLARGDAENRNALSAVRMKLAMRNSGRQAEITVLHLSRPLPLGRQARELQQVEAAAYISGDTILMGDFNQSPRMQGLRGFAARNGLAITRLGMPTWPTEIGGQHFPGLWQIDHLMTGRNWRVAAIRRSPRLGSDHWGLSADLCGVNTN